MKKFFTLIAAAMMAVGANAQVGFDFRDGTLGAQINEGKLITDMVNMELNETDASAHKYEIKTIEASVESTCKIGGITFYYKDSNAGKVAFKTYGTYIQANGGNRKIMIPTSAGEKVYVMATDACSGITVTGATVESIDLVAWGEDKDQFVTLEATGDQMVLVSGSSAKYKIGCISKAVPTAINAVSTTASESTKAVKCTENGQLVIKKGNNRYNAAGALLK